MSEIPDKRRRTDLDLFVLALIADGVATPYDLKQHAGLSPGATIPALNRLLQAGMVRQGKPGARGRIEYLVTRAGAKSLRTSWHALVEKGPSGDLDSDLRVALLACWSGWDRKLGMDFLKQSASYQLESVKVREGQPQGNRARALAESYKELLSVAATALIQCESDATLEIANALLRIRMSKGRAK